MDPGLNKIVLTGPESSGKSVLTRALAERFSWPYQKEYARSYLEEYGPAYNWSAFLHMYETHQRNYRALAKKSAGPILLDTDEINFLVWAEMVFERPLPDQEELHQRLQDRFYLLLQPDLPWKADLLRKDGHRRVQIFARHRHWLDHYQLPYALISGQGKQRQICAEQALRQEFTLGDG